ncbi:3edc43aa-7c77-4d1f-b990-96b3ce869a8f [Sclerotinia trifoliorum]|uniref:3edc43aa-7c77-4d1f-b990-96b3ce869a8f n=1 Tax=Sclerotinia trifoliorum TaxID=28548 RepID=A0A8H2ZS47_9HELO|nr:3edc43aa-7c77-4d1f-b990-96b3ce869a8f [Sclerotinia trifoliorum]
MLRPTKRKTQSSTLLSTSPSESDNRELSAFVDRAAGTTTAHTSNTLRDGSESTTTATIMADKTIGGADDPRKPLLGATGAGVRLKLPAKNRIINDGSYSSTTVSKSIASLDCEERDELDLEEEEEAQQQEQQHIMENISRKSQWILLAVASGACAAFNGVFAKLTTTQLTTSFAEHVAGFFGLGKGEKVVEYGVRGIFFLLNLVFNGIMWTLFTKALARGTSTVQVSIINTSSNFMITAVLGFMIFSESLPPLWFLGAALLVAGNVIIGRREEEEESSGNDMENGEGRRRSGSEGEEREGLLGEELELNGGIVEEADGNNKSDDDVLDLGLDDEGKSDEEEDLLIH